MTYNNLLFVTIFIIVISDLSQIIKTNQMLIETKRKGAIDNFSHKNSPLKVIYKHFDSCFYLIPSF